MEGTATATADTGSNVTPITSATGGGTAASSNASDTGSPDTGSSGSDTGEPTKAEIKKWTYRALRENGQYEDEELAGEDDVRARLSDDWEHTLKVDGKEMRVPLHQLRRHAQLGLTSTGRLEAAKQLKAEAEARLRAISETPYDAIDEADGYQFTARFDDIEVTKSDMMALKRAAEIHKLAMLRADPKRISEYVQLERERTERLRKARETAAEKRLKAESEKQAREQWIAKTRPEMASALKTAGMADNERNRQRVAARMKWAKDNDYNISLIDAAHFAREQEDAEFRDYLESRGGTDGQRLLAALGPKFAKLIREAEVKRVEAAPATQSQKREPTMAKIIKDARKDATAMAQGIKPIAFSRPR